MFKAINRYRSFSRQSKLLRLIQIPAQGRVLDVSCGDGAFVQLLHGKNPELELVGTDISSEQVGQASRDYPFARFTTANSSALPFPSEHFDLVFCNMSFHHYEQAREVMKELGRVLKTNGKVYVMDIVPKNKMIQSISNYFGCYEPYHFEKFYTLPEFESMAMENGLQLISSNQLAFFPTLLSMEFVKN